MDKDGEKMCVSEKLMTFDVDIEVMSRICVGQTFIKNSNFRKKWKFKKVH